MIFERKVRSILTAKPDRFGARLLPQQPHTNEELTVEVVGKVPEEAPSQAGVDCRVSTLQALTCCEWWGPNEDWDWCKGHSIAEWTSYLGGIEATEAQLLLHSGSNSEFKIVGVRCKCKITAFRFRPGKYHKKSPFSKVWCSQVLFCRRMNDCMPVAPLQTRKTFRLDSEGVNFALPWAGSDSEIFCKTPWNGLLCLGS